MLLGWAYFRDKVLSCKKNVAKEVCGRLFEAGVFSRDYGTITYQFKGALKRKSNSAPVFLNS